MSPTKRNRLRVLRADREMTQLTLSRKTRINPTRISFIENSLVEPEPKERDRLARALKTTVADLFPDQAPHEPQEQGAA